MTFRAASRAFTIFGLFLFSVPWLFARQAPEEEYSTVQPIPKASTSPPRKQAHPSIAIWQTLRKFRPGSDSVPAEVAALLGKTQEVAGFAIMNELSYDPTGSPQMSEFLITPIPGGCVHVPPPPPNFVLHVKMPRGKSTRLSFAPLWMKGKLTLPKKSADQKYYSYEMTPVSIEDFHDHIKK
jgi:hypothetical protein